MPKPIEQRDGSNPRSEISLIRNGFFAAGDTDLNFKTEFIKNGQKFDVKTSSITFYPEKKTVTIYTPVQRKPGNPLRGNNR
ncbi:MAG TPA: hypothetical protein VG917_04675 [Patescibacteria group bacterium]|nr:hypothetical protein [Patescibacteria group bacterium]